MLFCVEKHGVFTTENLLGSCFKLLCETVASKYFDETVRPIFLQAHMDNISLQVKKNCLRFIYSEYRQCRCERCRGTQLFH